MILRESIFADGEVIGIIRQDDFTGKIAFSATTPPSKLPEQDWESVDQLKAAIFTAYQKESPTGLTSGPSYPLDGITDYRKPETDG